MTQATLIETSAAPRAKRPRPSVKATCADCYFHQNNLCALNRNEPCPTFRAASEQLKAPQQLSFAFRQERTRSAWVFQHPS
jgi:hypothetical protein